MSTCTAKTSKKAWNNPLAPRAQCQREAVEGTEFCRIHSPGARELRYQKSLARWKANAEASMARDKREAQERLKAALFDDIVRALRDVLEPAHGDTAGAASRGLAMLRRVEEELS